MAEILLGELYSEAAARSGTVPMELYCRVCRDYPSLAGIAREMILPASAGVRNRAAQILAAAELDPSLPGSEEEFTRALLELKSAATIFVLHKKDESLHGEYRLVCAALARMASSLPAFLPAWKRARSARAVARARPPPRSGGRSFY